MPLARLKFGAATHKCLHQGHFYEPVSGEIQQNEYISTLVNNLSKRYDECLTWVLIQIVHLSLTAEKSDVSQSDLNLHLAKLNELYENFLRNPYPPGIDWNLLRLRILIARLQYYVLEESILALQHCVKYDFTSLRLLESGRLAIDFAKDRTIQDHADLSFLNQDNFNEGAGEQSKVLKRIFNKWECLHLQAKEVVKYVPGGQQFIATLARVSRPVINH